MRFCALAKLRGLRGSSFDDSLDASYLQSSVRVSDVPADECYCLGFRVATVPEPGTAVLAVLGFLALVAWGWRRKR